MGDHFDMRREQELVDRRDAGDAVAAIDQDAEIAGERAGIAGDGHEHRHVRLGKRRGLRRGAGARRIEHHRVVGFELLHAERRAEQVADEAPHRLEPGRLARRLGKRLASAASSASKASTAASCAKRKGEGAEPGEQIGEALGAATLRPAPVSTRVASASREAWRKAPGGSRTLAPDRSISRRGDRPDALAVDREPRHAERGGLAGKGAESGEARPHAFEHDIEAAVSLGHAHPRLALAAEQRDKRLFELGQALDDARREHRADVNVDQLMRAGAAIAESGPGLAPAKRERGAPAAAERHGPHLLDLGLKPARPQSGNDQFALPGEIGALLQVLERAAAANAEMRADRRDAVGARLEHLDQARRGRCQARPRR